MAAGMIGSRRQRARRVWLIYLWVVLTLFVLAFIGTMGVSYDVSWHLTHAARKPVKHTPSEEGLRYQSVQFPSRFDRLSIHGWLIPAAVRTDRIVIEAHGFRGNRSDDHPSLPVAKALHDAGFTVLMFDFRDEGESPGQFISIGLFERRDLLGAVDFAKSLGYKHIGFIGYSMGASTALEAAAAAPEVEAVVADSPFANLNDYLVDNMPVWTHLPNWPFTWEILLEARLFYHINPSLVNPLGDVEHWRPRPLLLIAGTADHLIPIQNSYRLYNAVRTNPKDTLWIVPGAGHVGAYDKQPLQYLHRVTQFFQENL